MQRSLAFHRWDVALDAGPAPRAAARGIVSVKFTVAAGWGSLPKVLRCVTVPPGMITVGCSGFAVPATRYFKEYGFVEVQETHRAVPGPGTIRRWRREAPDGFQFALLGPREIARLENDPNFREHGVLTLELHGGK